MTTNRLRRAASHLNASRIGRLFGRPVTVGWIVLVIWLLLVCVGLIAWSVRHNYRADQQRDARDEYLDCLATNDRRAEVEEIALELVGNDRFLIEFIDSFVPDGLDVDFKQPLLDRYQQQVDDIEAAYRAEPCQRPANLRSETP